MPFTFFNPDSQSMFPSALLQIKTYAPSSDLYLISRENGYMVTDMIYKIFSEYYYRNSPNVLVFRIIGAFYELVRDGGEFLVEEFHADGVREMPFIIQERPLDQTTLEIIVDLPNEEIIFHSSETPFQEIWRGTFSEFFQLYEIVDPSEIDPDSFRLD